MSESTDQQQEVGIDKTKILERLRAMAPELKARGIVTMSLFGSQARGDADEGSDIDIAVRIVQPEASSDGICHGLSTELASDKMY